jgi:hypothetical protein
LRLRRGTKASREPRTSCASELWQRERKDLIKANPDLSEDKVREVFWRAMDDAQLQTIAEKAMKDLFHEVSGQPRPN